MTAAARPIGILAMAYGTASGPDDIERYYTDIRGGRSPSPEHLEELKERYAAIGNRFPLLEITTRQAEALERELNASSEGQRFASYLGMKHSPPFIADGVRRMREDGIERAVGLVLAPHWSGMSVETYIERVQEAVDADGGPAFTFVRSWHDHPGFVAFLAARVERARETLGPYGDDALTIFSAHSLPTRRIPDGSLRCKYCFRCEGGCRYVEGLHETASLVADGVGLPEHAVAWQSAGRTDDPWWGPPVEDVIAEAGTAGRSGVVVCSAGFVADHLEILYDLDIEACDVAHRHGLAFARTEMPNDDPEFIRVLADVVREHLAAEGEPAAAQAGTA